MSIKVITAPEQIVPALLYEKKIFLAGSIEMGKAEDWQKDVIKLIESRIAPVKYTEIVIFNPRRNNWDASLEQVYENTVLNHQINWELTALEWADIIYFYFAPNTISPISLLELGTYKHKAIVYCSENYSRKANVDIYCERFKIKQVNSHQEGIDLLYKSLF